MQKLFSFILIFCVFLTACQQEFIPAPQNLLPQDSCRIKTAYYYGGSGGINDTANLIYNGGKLVRVEGEMADVIYSYTNNRITSMFYYEHPGGLLYKIDSFYYVNDTVISRMIINDYDMYNHYDTVRSVIDFSYNGTKLSHVTTVDSRLGTTDRDTTISDFRWTGDNVNSIYITSSAWADDSIYYQYDNNFNYFRNVSPNFFMADPFFELYVGLDPHLPLFISKNNVVNYTTNGGTINYPLEYQLDSMNHPVMVRSGGFDYMGYKYECP